MKLRRAENALRNIVFGVLQRLVSILLPFVSRTVLIHYLGVKYLGLSGLFASVLGMLNLAELGIGGAIVYSMYKPIAQGDRKTICALLKLYRTLFAYIGLFVLGAGLLCMPFLKYIVTDTIPAELNLYVLYLLYLSASVISYFLYAYTSSLLFAHQRNDVISKLGTLIAVVSFILQMGAIIFFQSYYLYVVVIPVFAVVFNLLRYIAVKKMYPEYAPAGQLDPELKKGIFKRVKALIGTKLNTVVVHSADTIVISSFLGLTAVALYSNYYLLLKSIAAFLGIAYSSVTAGLGNSLVIENLEKNRNDLKRLLFLNAWLVGWCSVCLICLYQPFMQLWLGEDFVLPFYMAALFAAYFYILQIRKVLVNYKDAAGIWWEDRLRPYVCMVVNLVSNIILVQYIGLAGIVISTILSMLISIPWETYTTFKHVFKGGAQEYYQLLLYYGVVTLVAGGSTFAACSFLHAGLPAFLARMLICILLPNLVFFLVLRKRGEFQFMLELIQRIMPPVFQRQKV